MMLRVNEPFLFKTLADDADAAVHHVGGSDDVGTCASLGENLFNEHFDGFIV